MRGWVVAAAVLALAGCGDDSPEDEIAEGLEEVGSGLACGFAETLIADYENGGEPASLAAQANLIEVTAEAGEDPAVAEAAAKVESAAVADVDLGESMDGLREACGL